MAARTENDWDRDIFDYRYLYGTYQRLVCEVVQIHPIKQVGDCNNCLIGRYARPSAVGGQHNGGVSVIACSHLTTPWSNLPEQC